MSADPKKSYFSNPDMNICWSGLETKERGRERGCADKDQEGEDVSDILMYVWP